MKLLITGVSGMIGSHLLEHLVEENHFDKIYGIDNLSVGKKLNIRRFLNHPNFVFIKGSILDQNLLNSLPKVDVIIHLAALKKIGEQNPGVINLKVNGIGTTNLLELAKKHKAKFIFGSTSDCYGMSPVPQREDDDLIIGPSMIKRWSYAVGKLFGEQMCFAYMKDFNIPVVVLRYFGAFSERSSFTWSGGHIPLFIDAVLKDQACMFHGDGSQTRSMTYVENLISPTIRSIFEEKAIGEIINLGDDKELSVLDTAKLIHKLAHTGKKLKLKFINTAKIFGKYKDIQRRRPDLTKAKALLDFKITVSLEEGILKVIKHYKKRKKHDICSLTCLQ